MMLFAIFLFYHLIDAVSPLLQLFEPGHHVKVVKVSACLGTLVLVVLAILFKGLIPFVHLMDVSVHFHVFLCPIFMINISEITAVVAVGFRFIASLFRD